MPGPLSPAEIALFKAEGYLILRSFLPVADVDSWRGEFWQHIRNQFPKFDPEDDSTWPDTKVIPGGFSVPFGKHPKMVAVAEQLGGGNFGGGGGGVLVNWPQEGAAADANKALEGWSPSAAGHVDGYGPGGWSGGFSLAATTYLADVEHGGGGFTFWPRSHRAVHKYFLQRPAEIDGSFYIREDWDQKAWSMFYDQPLEGDSWDFEPGPATEFTGQVGDVVLWHNFMCHTGSTNVRKGTKATSALYIAHQHEHYGFDIATCSPPQVDLEWAYSRAGTMWA